MPTLDPELDAKLWAAQLLDYPDSVRLNERTLWWVMYQSRPFASPEKFSQVESSGDKRYSYGDSGLYRDRNEARHEWLRDMEILFERHRAQVARTIALNLMDEMGGIFYACHRQPDGTYRHMGFRYGEGRGEYASGFMLDRVEIQEDIDETED